MRSDMRPVEIRDRGTCICAVAWKFVSETDAEARMLRRCGYHHPEQYVFVMTLHDVKVTWDCTAWTNECLIPSRTMLHAHRWLDQNFDSFKGGVLDIEYLNGEATEPKSPEVL